jgi:thiamine pyrophosphate-dependent acetolactate synthase large subunit-like protein
MAETITGAELVARTLKALGITTVFGLTGMLRAASIIARSLSA